ncbi:MAG: hypothetical protein SGJ27_27335 [Candidatus Melainabacteria bacterium]|nr:hypothetical protein [Candidatus Melainabacteria bacterium]
MLKELVGEWKVIGCQLHGKWLPYSIFQEFRYSFNDDDTFTLEWAELSFPQYVGGFPKSKTGGVAIDTSVSPNQMTWHHMKVRSRGRNWKLGHWDTKLAVERD